MLSFNEYLFETFSTPLKTTLNSMYTNMLKMQLSMSPIKTANAAIYDIDHPDGYKLLTFDEGGAKEVHLMPNSMEYGRLGTTTNPISLFSTAVHHVTPHLESGGTVRLLAHPETFGSYARMLSKYSKRGEYDFKEIKDYLAPDGIKKDGWEISKKSKLNI
jgi:hypothetical protein